MSTRAVNCPNCQKVIQVPAEAAGKKIRCKACQQVFAVPGTDPPAKPAVARPAVARPPAKPAAPPPPPPPPPADANAPIPFADDDDDDDDTAGGKPKIYGVTKDADEEIARCPFCTLELEPQDAKICTNCGYDMAVRKRHRTVQTHALTGGDYFMWWLPAILWAGVLLFCGGVVAWSFIALEPTFRKQEIGLKEEKNPLTDEREFIVHPAACGVCCALDWIILAAWGVPAIYKRIKQPKPTEEEKRK